jgi:hypothetical protein
VITAEDKFQALLRVLDLVNYQDDLAKHGETRLEGTCEWSLDHSKIKTWLDLAVASRLWIYGGPGTGKSTLAAYLIDQARRRAPSDTDMVVYFFGDNKRQDSTKQSTVLILKVLIAQLVKRRSMPPQDLDEIMDDVLSKGPNYRFAVRDMTKHLISASKGFRRIWCVSMITHRHILTIF